jgi:hypothetical protein
MPIIKGAASDFTSFQKNTAQANSFFNYKYSRVGQQVAAPSITSSQALASKVSLTASSRTVASFINLQRGYSTRFPQGINPANSKIAAGPRYFLD